MVVLKFGGTSMGDEHTWRRVIDIIKRYKKAVVVVSATAKTTRRLVASAEQAVTDSAAAHQIAEEIRERHQQLITEFLDQGEDNNTRVNQKCQQWIDDCIRSLKTQLSNVAQAQELSKAAKDGIASVGERLSSYLFAQCARTYGLSTSWVDAADIIRTDSDFGQANPNTSYIEQHAADLSDLVDDDMIPVMGGFYGEDEKGNITTLGFEGSDYSASLIGAAMGVDAIEIWTDVSGIYTCDPRFVEDAHPIAELSFQEATELAYFGAKVLHPATTKPASAQNIPIKVKNIFAPDEPGTRISHEFHEGTRVKAITFKQYCSVITVTSSHTVMGYEFLSDVFDILRWHHLAVDVVTTTEASVSIAIEDGDKIDSAIDQLSSIGNVQLHQDQGIISLVGCSESDASLLINEVLSNIDSSDIQMISFSRSKGNLNLVLQSEGVLPSVQAIHKSLFSRINQ